MTSAYVFVLKTFILNSLKNRENDTKRTFSGILLKNNFKVSDFLIHINTFAGNLNNDLLK